MFKMINVGEKKITRRKAIATGKIHMSEETIIRIMNKQMPKGDVLAMAEVAGIMAAKNTSQILPLCHPLLIDQVNVKTQPMPEGHHITVECEVLCHSKTGVEMEALMGVQAALLAIYDLTKGVDPDLTLTETYLKVKEGGKSGLWVHPRVQQSEGISQKIDYRHEMESSKLAECGGNRGHDLSKSAEGSAEASNEGHHKGTLKNMRAAVITLSDRASQKIYKDLSGPQLVDFLRREKIDVVQSIILPDDKDQLIKKILFLSRELKLDLIFTTGGTGIGPRDRTAEALKEILFLLPNSSFLIPGIGELLRSTGSSKTPLSWLSRSGGYCLEKTLVITLPGSPKAVQEGWEALQKILPHTLEMLQAEGGPKVGGHLESGHLESGHNAIRHKESGAMETGPMERQHKENKGCEGLGSVMNSELNGEA